jgi:hypothetical protein
VLAFGQPFDTLAAEFGLSGGSGGNGGSGGSGGGSGASGSGASSGGGRGGERAEEYCNGGALERGKAREARGGEVQSR